MGPVEKLKAGNKDDLFAASQKLLAEATDLEKSKKVEDGMMKELQQAAGVTQAQASTTNQTEVDLHRVAAQKNHQIAAEQEDIARKLMATFSMLDKKDKQATAEQKKNAEFGHDLEE